MYKFHCAIPCVKTFELYFHPLSSDILLTCYVLFAKQSWTLFVSSVFVNREVINYAERKEVKLNVDLFDQGNHWSSIKAALTGLTSLSSVYFFKNNTCHSLLTSEKMLLNRNSVFRSPLKSVCGPARQYLEYYWRRLLKVRKKSRLDLRWTIIFHEELPGWKTISRN